MTTTTNAPAPATLDFMGVPCRVLATGGGLGLVDMLDVPAGHMPPLHVHHDHDEGFYVLDGVVELLMPDRSVTLGPGDFFLAPRGVPHAYRVSEDASARWLVTSTPSGFERFVAAVDATEDPDPGRVAGLAAEHGIEILGPPGTLP